MNKLFWCFLLLVFGLGVSSDVVSDNLYLHKHAILGPDAIAPGVGLDVELKNLADTTQIGAYIRPYWNSAATVGGAGVRIWPRTVNGAGHIPYVHMLDIYTPLFGTSSGGKRVYGVYVNNITGGDSANYSWYSNLGLFSVGDTATFRRIAQFGAAVQYHGRPCR